MPSKSRAVLDSFHWSHNDVAREAPSYSCVPKCTVWITTYMADTLNVLNIVCIMRSRSALKFLPRSFRGEVQCPIFSTSSQFVMTTVHFAAKRHRACSAPRYLSYCLTFQCGEGEGEGELETQYFTTSAMSQPAMADVLQRV